MDWSLIIPAPNEVAITDRAAERDAQASLGHDAEELGYTLTNLRVSRLEKMKIVRIDLYDPAHRKTAGIAIRVVTGKKIEEGIKLF